MASQLYAISFDVTRPSEAARFWSALLGWQSEPDPDGGFALEPADDTGLRLRFLPTSAPRTGPNHLHLHLTSNLAPQQETVDRALALGARHLDVGQKPDEDHVVLADPEGTEFCVIEAGNRWLADHGFMGDVACDGTRELGLFWSAALDWPLVWDQDGETAIRNPAGGPKIAWGGPPLNEYDGPARVHFDLTIPPHADLEAEATRLITLGATRRSQSPNGSLTMTDPDGNEFRLLTPR